MKRRILQLLTLVMMGMLVCCACSCSSNASRTTGPTNTAGGNSSEKSGETVSGSLIGGTWTDPETGISMEFMKNGKLHYIQVGDLSSELWLGYEIKGDTIIISYAPGDTETMHYSLKEGTLSITWEDGNISTLKRANSQ